MTPSGADLDIAFNPNSIIENVRKLERSYNAAMKSMKAGTADASAEMENFSKEFGSFSQQVVNVTNRSKVAQENYIRSLERGAAALGKTGESAAVARMTDYIKKLGNNEEAIKRVTAARQKYIDFERQQGARVMENEIRALEKLAASYGKTPVEKMKADAAERAQALKGSTELINRQTVAINQLIAAEEQEARVAKEREVQGVQRRGAIAGMNPAQRRQMTQAEELAKFGGDPRIAAAHEQENAAAARATAEAREREVRALEERAELIGKNDEERMLARQARELKEYNGDLRVAAVHEKELAEFRRKETEAIESETRALERQAGIRKSGAGQRREELHEEIRLGKLDAETIDRRTTAINKLEEAEKKRGHGTGNLIFRGVRDIFEGRTAYGTMDLLNAGMGGMGAAEAGGAAGLASSLGAGVVGTAGLAAGLGLVAAAGYKATESIGALGAKIRETQLITGMSAREIQEFEVAEKLTGHTAENVTGLMRGLARVVTENSASARKAREAFKDVDFAGMQTGAVGMSRAIEQLGAFLDKKGNIFEKDAALLDIAKRNGFAAAGAIEEYMEARKRAAGIPFLSDEQVEQAKQMNTQLVLMKANLGAMFDQFELWAGRKFIEGTYGWAAFVESIRPFWMAPPEAPPKSIKEQVAEAPRGASESIAEHRAQRMAAYKAFVGGQSDQEAMQQELERRKQDYNTALGNTTLFLTNPKQFYAEVGSARSSYESYKASDDARKKAEEARRTNTESLARLKEQVTDSQANPYRLPGEIAADKQRGVFAAQAADQGLKGRSAEAYINRQYKPYAAGYQALTDQQRTEQADKFQRQMLEVQESVQREKFRAGLGGVQPVDIRELGQGGVTRADVEKDINEAYRQRLDIAQQTKETEEELINKRKIDARDSASLAQQARDLVTASGKEEVAQVEAAMAKKREEYELDKKERDQAREHAEAMSKIQLADLEESIKHDADLARKSAELRFKGDNPAAGIAAEYRIATEEAQQLYGLEMKRIALHETGYKAEEDAAVALHKLHREDEQAREDAQYKLAKMQQEQLDKLKGAIEPLYETLFTNPKNFGKQLRSTVTEAALHPIVSGLSEMTATALHPFIYGATGTGGIAGALGGLFGGGHNKFNDIALLPDKSLPVTVVNMPGGGGTSIYSIGGFGGGGTTDRFGSQFRRFIQGGPSASGDYSGGGYAPSSDAEDAWTASLPGGGGGYGGFGSGTVAGSRGFNLSGFSGLARSLAGSWRQLTSPAQSTTFGETPGGESMARALAGPGFLGHLKSFGASPLARAGAGAAGSMLAQAGLLGNTRGTAGGVFEGMLGGAGVGFSMGGPLGAGIGAAAGLGIGLGEVIAGVESPRNEAKRLVTSLYHITISNSTADQIVQTANQSYAGHVSLAVRSPEVRHMLGLYAAGTGQSNLFGASANDPHGASLVESGGRLMQQATYQYGNAFTQSSNLPVYGGVPSQTLGSPGGMNLSLNIGGTDAAKFLQGNVVSPDVISTQYAQAMNGSNGRVSQALMMSEPGSIAS